MPAVNIPLLFNTHRHLGGITPWEDPVAFQDILNEEFTTTQLRWHQLAGVHGILRRMFSSCSMKIFSSKFYQLTRMDAIYPRPLTEKVKSFEEWLSCKSTKIDTCSNVSPPPESQRCPWRCPWRNLPRQASHFPGHPAVPACRRSLAGQKNFDLSRISQLGI